MVDLMRGLLGAVAGGADAYGEILDERSKDAKQKAKDLMDQKRQENYLKLQNDYAMARQESGQKFTAGEKGSGQYLDGRELSRSELENLSPDQKTRIQSKADYDAGIMKQKSEYEKGLIAARGEEARKTATTKTASKGKTSAEKKLEAQNAFYDVQSKLMTFGASQPVEGNNRYFEIPSGKMSPEEMKQMAEIISARGFDPEGNVLADGTIVFSLGSYKPEKVRSYQPPAKETPTDNTDKALVDKYRKFRQGGQTPAQTPEAEKPLGLIASHETDPTSIMNLPRTPEKSVAAPQAAPEVSKTLSPEISSWNVVQQTRAGKPVYIETNSGRLLSEEEYAAYVKYLQGQSSNLGKYLQNLPDTGAVQKRREQAQKSFLR